MATWQHVVRALRATREVISVSDRRVVCRGQAGQLVVELCGGFDRRGDAGLVVWAELCPADRFDPLFALRFNDAAGTGSVAIRDDRYVVRHLLPLDLLQVEALARALDYVDGVVAAVSPEVALAPPDVTCFDYYAA